MLLSCLETETSSFNLRYLLHLIEVYVYEDVGFCPGLVGVVVKTIQEKVLAKNGSNCFVRCVDHEVLSISLHVLTCPFVFPFPSQWQLDDDNSGSYGCGLVRV
jgi:hypothetical protein